MKEVFTIEKRYLATMTASVSVSLRLALETYDIIHIHTKEPCVMLGLPKFFSKRYIATIHSYAVII